VSSSSQNPAGQEYRAQGSRESFFGVQPLREEEGLTAVQSLPPNDDIIPEQPVQDEETPEPESPVDMVLEAFRCARCPLTFPKRCLFNKHQKRHDRPFKCAIRRCPRAFQYRKDLNRHRAARHRETVQDLVLLYCGRPGCKFSIEHGPGSSRIDNLRRHIRTQHEADA